MNTSYVYIVGVSTNPVKIGHAADVVTRVSQLQIGNPDQLTVHKTFQVDWSRAADIERQIHKKLEKERRRGEWFNVDAERAIKVASGVVGRIEGAIQRQIEDQDHLVDGIARVARRVAVHGNAREAVEFYTSEWRVKRDTKAVRTMNAYIVQEAGAPALVLFEKVVLEGLNIEYALGIKRHGDETREQVQAGYAVLAQALNALARYYTHRKNLLVKRLWTVPTDSPFSPSAKLREITRLKRLANQTAAIAKKAG